MNLLKKEDLYNFYKNGGIFTNGNVVGQPNVTFSNIYQAFKKEGLQVFIVKRGAEKILYHYMPEIDQFNFVISDFFEK